MAEKRCISKSISISEKVNMLPDTFDMLLFTWLIVHTDDFGRITGSPAKVKALVVPMLDKKMKDVEHSLHVLHAAELIIYYQIDNDKYIQIVNFDKHQSGLHKRTKSKIPELPGTSRNYTEIPLEEKGTEQKGTEQEGSNGGGVYSLYQSSIGMMNGTIKQMIDDDITSYSELWVEEAIKESVRQNKNKYSYVHGILKKWKVDGKGKVIQIQSSNSPKEYIPDPELAARVRVANGDV